MRTCCAIVAFACVRALVAQETPGERVVVLTVVSTGDRSVFFDHGRDVGLAPGTFVRLMHPLAGRIEIEVRAVTQTSARADLPPGMPVPPVGTRCEARVRTAAPAQQPRAAPPREVPEHPPWTRNEPPRTADQPLLVPTFGQRPDQRPATLDGWLFGSLQWSEYGADRDVVGGNDYLLARLGAHLEATNVLGTGERWETAGEFDVREADVAFADDVDDRTGRLDLLSVEFGAEGWAPTGAQFGRFYSQYLPEIGLVDGVEVARRFQNGLRLGAGLGAYPRPYPARNTGDDVGAHVFADWTADAERSFAAAVGLQKTWHRGDADRDLLLLRAEWRPVEPVSLLGTAKVDVYTSDDVVKGSGVELTEAFVQARCDGDVLGAGIAASHFTWPELLREEYVRLPVELVRDGYVDRVALDGSFCVSSSLSVRVMADLWRDQDRDGTALGCDLDWRGLWSRTSALAISAFANDGGYTTGPGARVALRDGIGDVDWRVAYRWYDYELPDLASAAGTMTRQSAEVGLAWRLGAAGHLDLSAQRWFGDDEDATDVGLYVQWRF